MRRSHTIEIASHQRSCCVMRTPARACLSTYTGMIAFRFRENCAVQHVPSEKGAARFVFSGRSAPLWSPRTKPASATLSGAAIDHLERVVGQFDCGRIAGLNLGGIGAYWKGCLSRDQLSGHGKIPDLAGGSIFCGPWRNGSNQGLYYGI